MPNSKTVDKEWNEYEVHVGQGNDEADAEEEYQPNFFEDYDKDEVLEFQFDSLKNGGDPVEIRLRGQSEITNSTGLSVWLGAEVLCDFLVRNRTLVERKSVLELGAGLGLTGILVSRHLNASRTVLTDGDTGVLHKLRTNVGETHFCHTSPSCPQLIWGRNVADFRQQYGRFQVILATDCVYMTTSLEPLWETIHGLLEENEDAVVAYVNLCASQAPEEEVLKMAKRFGFSWLIPSRDVYLFRRQMAVLEIEGRKEGQ